MAYIIQYGESDLYRAGDESLALQSARMSQSATQPGSLTIVMPPTHALASTVSLHDFDNPIFVQWDTSSRVSFMGFITGVSRDIDGMLTMKATEMTALLDMPKTRLSDHGYTKSFYATNFLLTAILTAYNNMVPDNLKLRRAYVNTASDAIGYTNGNHGVGIDCEPDALMSPLEMYQRWVMEPFGAVLSGVYSRYGMPSSDVMFAKTAFQSGGGTVERGVNLLRVENEVNTDDIATGVYAVGGKGLAKTGGSQTGIRVFAESGSSFVRGDKSVRYSNGTVTVSEGDRLGLGGYIYTVSKVQTDGATTYLHLDKPIQTDINSSYTNAYLQSSDVTYTEYMTDLSQYDGATYNRDGFTSKVSGANLLYSPTMVNRYGLIVEQFNVPDVIAPAYLRELAHTRLAGIAKTSTRYAVDAVDPCLYSTSSSASPLMVGSLVTLKDAALGIDVQLPLSSAEVDLLDPSASRYSIGATMRTMTDRIKSQGNNIAQLQNRR